MRPAQSGVLELAPVGAARAYVQEALRWLPDSQMSAADARLDPPPRDSPGHELPPARVLVADDNADMRAYLRELSGRGSHRRIQPPRILTGRRA